MQILGLPLNWNSPDFVPPEEAPCIIDKISDMDTEAKYMKTYHCRTFIINMFSNGTLKGNEKDFTGLFDVDTFEINFKNICRAYEAHLLNKLDFDERIFLGKLLYDFAQQLFLDNLSLLNSPESRCNIYRNS